MFSEESAIFIFNPGGHARRDSLMTPSHLRTALPMLAVALACPFAVPDSASGAENPTPPPAETVPVTKGLRVFTAGHSFHVWVAPILADIAKSAGITDQVLAGTQSIGGSQVIDHWLAGDGDKDKLIPRLAAGEIDVLTVSPIYLPDAGLAQFANFGFQHNPNFRLTVLKLWVPNDEFVPHFPYTPRKYDQNETEIPRLRQSQNAYDAGVNGQVKLLNEKLGRPVVVTVPAGQAVAALREKVVAGTAPGVKSQAELFQDKWGHALQVIKALEGYCEFAVIYRQSPVGLPVPPILREAKIDPADLEPLNKLLQELAWDAVIHDPMSGVTAKP